MEKSHVTIEVMKDGPFIVKDLLKLQNAHGEDLPGEPKVALCRCGASANKPYCDGAHVKIGFSGQREIDKPLDRERSYESKQITIHDNRAICSHAAECVNKLPSVFRLGQTKWIEPDAGEVSEIIDVVNRCPSGALSYTINDIRYGEQDREACIKISKDGPYNIEGKIELHIGETLRPPSKEHFSLCRCGASKNKPYCDGSHRDVGFKDDNH